MKPCVFSQQDMCRIPDDGTEIRMAGNFRENDLAVAAVSFWRKSPYLMPGSSGNIGDAQHYLACAAVVKNIDFNDF